MDTGLDNVSHETAGSSSIGLQVGDEDALVATPGFFYF